MFNKMLSRNINDHNNVNAKRVAEQMTILRGERMLLKDYLVQSLQESGWDDKVRILCREEIAKANGLISVDSLVDRVTPKARKEIPDELKADMILKIKKVLLQAKED
ncbi:CLUMA_CG006227, isoform A [Clunio marinus]|uniref:Enhancer of yellow 2 transcription factor n=1 Tax=Clunio marinus TaxID=568069 RepID=A0A1J1HXK7_9DIPT|nr:CLUMA_CG006227, isoform A [Clunio marinus]